MDTVLLIFPILSHLPLLTMVFRFFVVVLLLFQLINIKILLCQIINLS